MNEPKQVHKCLCSTYVCMLMDVIIRISVFPVAQTLSLRRRAHFKPQAATLLLTRARDALDQASSAPSAPKSLLSLHSSRTIANSMVLALPQAPNRALA